MGIAVAQAIAKGALDGAKAIDKLSGKAGSIVTKKAMAKIASEGTELTEDVMEAAINKGRITKSVTKGAIYGAAGVATVGGVMNIDDGLGEFAGGTLGGAGLGAIGGAGVMGVATAIAKGVR